MIDTRKSTAGRIEGAEYQIKLDDGTIHDAKWIYGIGKPRTEGNYQIYIVPLKRMLIKTTISDTEKKIIATCKIDTLEWVDV